MLSEENNLSMGGTSEAFDRSKLSAHLLDYRPLPRDRWKR